MTIQCAGVALELFCGNWAGVGVSKKREVES